MPFARLPLLEGMTTLELAKESDNNMLHQLCLPHHRREFFDHLWMNRGAIESIVCHHLSLSVQQCSVANRDEWMSGSFNVCIPVWITNWKVKRVLFRCPLPYKIGGRENADEKIGCEAATYTWIREKCPNAPIPYLWGVGFHGTSSFTPIELLPWRLWLVEKLRRLWATMCQRPPYSSLASHKRTSTLESGYLLLEFVEQGNLLSNSWLIKKQDKGFRRTLFRSLSEIILLLGQPSDRIGSFTLDKVGRIILTNRPLTLRLHALENKGVPAVIPRDRCYSNTLHYLSDLLRYQDEQFRQQPNSVRDKNDANAQMATLTVMRSIIPNYFQQAYCGGPFIFQMTDLRPHNIFVQQDGQVVKIIDLEWSCFLPIESNHPPFWLSGYELDHLENDAAIQAFSEAADEFLRIFEEEEKRMFSSKISVYPRADVIRESLRRGTQWCLGALNEPRAMYNIFCHHIQPKFAPEHQSDSRLALLLEQIMSRYWVLDSDQFVASKLKEKAQYDVELEKRFIQINSE